MSEEGLEVRVDSTCLENLKTALSSFLSWFLEYSVSALVTGFSHRSNFNPFDMPAPQTLVTSLEGVHW